MSSNQVEALVPPVRVVPPVDRMELLFTAAVGAASLSLRVVLDAVAGVTGRPRQAPTDLTRVAFASLAFGLSSARSLARAADRGLLATERAAGLALDAVPRVLRSPVDGRVSALRERERAQGRELGDAELLAEDLVAALVPRIAFAILDQLDLTALVKDRVDIDEIVRCVDLDAVVERLDLDAVAARLDVNAIAARLDVEAIIDRLDLAGLAQTVIDEIDLPEIIRRSTGVVASETVRGVRMQGIEADRAIAGFVDRVLGRRRPRLVDANIRSPEDAIPPGEDRPL
jgi:hypothetical protein